MTPQNSPSSNSSKNARRLVNFLIYPKFQLSLIGLNLGIILSALIIFWITAYNLIQNLTPTAALSGIDAQFYRRYLEYQKAQFNGAFAISIVVAIVLSSLVTLVLSHRLAGPFIRMKNFFSGLKAGGTRIPKLTFRDGDYFQELPPIVNNALSRLMGVSDNAETLEMSRHEKKTA
jgi:hypothetical protein